ncbi:hypothetical protein [Chryseobacterium schmidteae]|uniref:hypothetical protein n=1 Tax=Chryseobacterium schmidteae TaxID=2730404 RepID=UPI00158A93FC|nr:hypothetical protein [Chryseobacterium schmidteae]
MKICFTQKPLIALSLIVAPFYFSQNRAEEALKKFEENYPQEKIHLLLSKKNYVAGENLWFKSFVFNGYSPSKISTTIFIELYDQNKKILSKKIFPLLNGEGSGSISLPEDLKENIYYIRAYTTWMGNFSDDYNKIQPITVYNLLSTEKLIKKENAEWSVSLFPEGSTIIDGISTKFAVRLNSDGETPTKWSGFVTELQNPENKIISFNGFDQNIGSFTFIPETGKSYLLTVKDHNGVKKTINIPKASVSGVHFEVENNNGNIRFRLKSKNISQKSKYRVLGTVNNNLVFEANISALSNKIYALPNDKSINGVLYFTVLDENNKIVAERLCFVDPHPQDSKKIILKDISLNYNPKESNTFKINQNSKITNYTVAISDVNNESTEDENSLLSNLYLTGDITSKIYKPAQYFDERKNKDALDALLISEHWNRFSWKSLLSGKYPIISHKPTNYLSYKGKAIKQGQPASEEEINLLFKTGDNNLKFNLIKTDQNGFFTINNLFFEDKMDLSYQLNKGKVDKNSVQLYIQPEFSFLPLRKELPKTDYLLEPRYKEEKTALHVEKAIASSKSEKILKGKFTEIEEVKIIAEKKSLTQKLNNELSSPMFRGMSETVFDFVNENNMISNSGNILQWLQGRAPGVTFHLGEANPKIMYRGSSIPLYIDEFQVQPSDIGGISPSDVAMIKFIRNDFRGVSGGAVGAILVYTRRGNMPRNIDTSKPSVRNEIKLTGYHKEETFNNDIYKDINLKTTIEDKRSILYWNPYLESKSGEPTIVQWYNNDDAKNFRVMIIGFDENNDLLYYNEVLK